MMKTGFLIAAASALLIQPGVASARKPTPPPAPVALPYQSANLPTAGEVQAVYANWRYGPIWYRGGAASPAVRDLLNILQRAPLDGLASGPQIAAQVQAAVQRASTGDAAAVAFADHTLSEALLLYARAMKKPVPGMIYGYDYLKPAPVQASSLLQAAFGAPSLQLYVQQLANPNTIYTSIRDAAWQQMQATGSTTPDPRVVANLERARGMPSKGRFVLVNPAVQMLYMYENGVPVDSMKVVVGDYGKNIPRVSPTPMISSVIFYTIHNPYWNAPDLLVKKNIAPRYLAEGDKYLKSRGFRVMSDWTANAAEVPAKQVDWKAVAAGKTQIRVRQDPGPDNFMGQLKFPFANPEDIFLHDTDPADRNLFGMSDRARSNGCVRLEDARRFGRWLLGHDPITPSTEAEYAERLPQGMPVYLVYLTAQPQNGQLTFARDIYGLDPAADTRVAANR
jgi:murein L,D-transpeptidase YcbB/YkuD